MRTRQFTCRRAAINLVRRASSVTASPRRPGRGRHPSSRCARYWLFCPDAGCDGNRRARTVPLAQSARQKPAKVEVRTVHPLHRHARTAAPDRRVASYLDRFNGESSRRGGAIPRRFPQSLRVMLFGLNAGKRNGVNCNSILLAKAVLLGHNGVEAGPDHSPKVSILFTARTNCGGCPASARPIADAAGSGQHALAVAFDQESPPHRQSKRGHSCACIARAPEVRRRMNLRLLGW